MTDINKEVKVILQEELAVKEQEIVDLTGVIDDLKEELKISKGDVEILETKIIAAEAQRDNYVQRLSEIEGIVKDCMSKYDFSRVSYLNTDGYDLSNKILNTIKGE